MGIFSIKKKWYIDYYYEGQRIRRAVGAKRDARNALAAIKADILREEYRFTTKSKIRFENFAEEYLNYSKANKKSWVRDSASLKHLVPHLKSMVLSRIMAKDIEDYKQERLNHVKPATVNRELTLLKFMFSLAIKWKYTNSNPVKEVKFFKEQQYIVRLLNSVEAKRLIESASTRLKPIIIIALNTGMRRGEILSLRWNDVDFDRNFIFIREAKSGDSRKVPMNSLVRDTLKNVEGVNDEYIFYDSGTKSCRIEVRSPFDCACKRANIKKLRFQDLRHTAASWMVEAGIDLVTVKEILGHSQIQTTMRYAHPTPQNKLRAVSVLEKLLCS